MQFKVKVQSIRRSSRGKKKSIPLNLKLIEEHVKTFPGYKLTDENHLAYLIDRVHSITGVRIIEANEARKSANKLVVYYKLLGL